jgi:hypothetical protein
MGKWCHWSNTFARAETIKSSIFFAVSLLLQFHTFRNPQLRVVIPHYAQKGDKDSTDPEHYFPIEMLVIMPDQRVPLEKMSQNLSQQLLLVFYLFPFINLFSFIVGKFFDTRSSLHTDDGKLNKYLLIYYLTILKQHCERLKLFTNDNPVLKAFGISINRDSNDVMKMNHWVHFPMYIFLYSYSAKSMFVLHRKLNFVINGHWT